MNADPESAGRVAETLARLRVPDDRSLPLEVAITPYAPVVIGSDEVGRLLVEAERLAAGTAPAWAVPDPAAGLAQGDVLLAYRRLAAIRTCWPTTRRRSAPRNGPGCGRRCS
jgi:hypothetical protein